MSALRAAPTGVFELQRSSSFRGLQPATQKYASEEGDERTSLGEMPQGVSDYEEEEEEVDESVREDMTKLEDTFPGISDRFRLVNRIGEGMGWIGSPAQTLEVNHWIPHRNLFNGLQSGRSTL